MKKVILIGFVVLCTITSYAQRNADLTIGTTGANNLKIRLNGKRITLKDKSVTFENMQPGTYTLSIYQWLKKANRNYEYVEVFNNTVNLTAGKHIEVVVLRFGKVVWDEGFITDDDWNDGSNNGPIGGGIGNNGNGYSTQQAVNDAQFKEIKSAINKAFSDNDKLVAAKAIMKNNWFNINQIKELTRLFFYDDKKLIFLKEAYDNCTEKGSYFTLADLLFSETSKNDFMKWLGGK